MKPLLLTTVQTAYYGEDESSLPSFTHGFLTFLGRSLLVRPWFRERRLLNFELWKNSYGKPLSSEVFDRFTYRVSAPEQLPLGLPDPPQDLPTVVMELAAIFLRAVFYQDHELYGTLYPVLGEFPELQEELHDLEFFLLRDDRIIHYE